MTYDIMTGFVTKYSLDIASSQSQQFFKSFARCLHESGCSKVDIHLTQTPPPPLSVFIHNLETP